MSTKSIYLVLSLILSSQLVFGQQLSGYMSTTEASKTAMDLQRSILFENDSKSEEIILEVNPSTKRFDLSINATINIGELTVEVYDPQNTKQGNFTVQTQLSSNKEELVTGNFRKSLREPQSGQWKVKIIPDKATGKMNIQTAIIE